MEYRLQCKDFHRNQVRNVQTFSVQMVNPKKMSLKYGEKESQVIIHVRTPSQKSVFASLICRRHVGESLMPSKGEM